MKVNWKKPPTTAPTPPGSVIYKGEPRTEPIRLTVFDYDEQSYRELDNLTVEEWASYKTTRSVSWINVSGVHDTDVVGQLGAAFEIHPLVLEDIVHVHQLPKQDEFETYQFIVLRMLHVDERGLSAEQVSLVFGDRWVISFQEYSGDVFEPVRKRIRSGKGRIRRLGHDYLAYALLDTIVDHYFAVIDGLSERLEALEEDVLDRPEASAVTRATDLRKELVFVRKAVWPLRQVCADLVSAENRLVSSKVRVFFRDVEDHVLQAVAALDSHRELLAGILDLYQTSTSNRLNEIMKLLTMVGTVFIPISFLAGLYGMNFEVMPELSSPFGYPIVVAVMVSTAGGSLLYFKKRGWL